MGTVRHATKEGNVAILLEESWYTDFIDAEITDIDKNTVASL